MKISVLTLLLFLSLGAFAENYFPIITPNVRINLENDKELKGFISSLLKDDDSAVSVFDEIQKGKIQISLLNDYSLTGPNSSNRTELNDDLGRSYGYKIVITKNIAPNGGDKYYATISYQSEIYLNSTEPEKFKNDFHDVLYLNEDGFLQADVFYKEENLVKLILGKVQSNDAYYWKAGVGYHEMNATDTERGFFISSLAQQSRHHRSLNKKTGGPYREYNYLPQTDMNDRGMMLEAQVGRDFTLIEDGGHRAFVRSALEARLTQVENASYVGAEVNAGYDFVPQVSQKFLVPVRIMGGHVVKKFENSKYRHSFIEVSAQRSGITFTLQYLRPQTSDPDYLNPLPLDFPDRENMMPKREPVISISLEGKFF